MRCRLTFLLLLLLVPVPARAQAPDPAKLTLDRVFNSPDFRGDPVPDVNWLDGGAYTSLQPSKRPIGGSDIVRVDATGKGEVLVAAEKLVPAGRTGPLGVDAY